MFARAHQLVWLAVAAALMIVSAAWADVPSRMNYQVMLTDEEGDPLPGSHSLVFRIFDAETDGTELWSETRTLEANSIGVISAVMGSETPIAVSLPDSCWLEVQVDGEILTPRRELVCSPYAFRAADSDKLGGVDAGSYSLEGHDHDADYVNEGQANGVTTDMILPDFVGSIDGVSNDGGNIDLVEGSNITITPDDGANTITISATPGGDGGDITAVYADWGLTGTATSGDAHLSVGSGDGLNITADAVSVDITDLVGDGLIEVLNDFTVGAGDGIDVSTSAVAVDVSDFAGLGLEDDGANNLRIATGGVTAGMVSPSIVSSVDGVSNDGGNIDLVQGSNITITPDDGANTITIAASGGDDGDWTQSGGDVYRATGNVGIGTSSPNHPLGIHSDVGGDRFVQFTNANTGSGVFDGLRVGINYLGTGYITHGESEMLIIETDAIPRIAIEADGDVGIGTTTPGSKLDVSGTVEVDGFKLVTGGAAGRVLTSDASGVGAWAEAPGPRTIDNVGNDGGNIDLVEGANITITPNDSANTITIAASAADDGDWTQSGPDVYRATGSVGIGTTMPDGTLEVEGHESVGIRVSTDYLSGSAYPLRVQYAGTGEHDVRAILSQSTPTDWYGYGGEFIGGYTGVLGSVTPTGSQSYYGVKGLVDGGDGYNYGVYGSAAGSGDNQGVRGYALGEGTGTSYGVYGTVGGTGTTYAGYFNGLLYANSASASIKAFKIDHPLDPEHKYLNHSSVESPDMMNIYNGNVVLDADGSAWIDLPEWFEALNRDFRYQLTPVGAPAPNLYVAEGVSRNRFRIAGGEPGMTVSWQVTGIRHDPLADARRVTVEEAKPVHEVGRYLNPEVYGAPRESGIGYYPPPGREKEKSASR